MKEISELLKKKRNSYLLLVGEGPLMPEIKEKCEKLGILKNIIFAGTCTNVHELLQIMNGFIFPSKQEGLGIALIEAQAAKIYCVVSDTIPKEAVVSDKLITLSLNESPSKWADAFINEEISKDKHNDLKDFSIKGVNDKLRRIYKSIINSRNYSGGPK